MLSQETLQLLFFSISSRALSVINIFLIFNSLSHIHSWVVFSCVYKFSFFSLFFWLVCLSKLVWRIYGLFVIFINSFTLRYLTYILIWSVVVYMFVLFMYFKYVRTSIDQLWQYLIDSFFDVYCSLCSPMQMQHDLHLSKNLTKIYARFILISREHFSVFLA